MAATRPRAPWTASTSSPSWFDWRCSTVRPWRAASARAVATWSSRVAVPYTSGWRSPSRFRFGPDSSRTVSGSEMSTGTAGLQGVEQQGPVGHGDGLDAVRAVEDEGDAPDGLLVPAEQVD